MMTDMALDVTATTRVLGDVLLKRNDLERIRDRRPAGLLPESLGVGEELTREYLVLLAALAVERIEILDRQAGL